MAQPLTPREKDVLAMLANGSPIGTIADAFGIADRTARAHIQTIVRKLDVNDSAEAVAIAFREGIIPPRETEP